MAASQRTATPPSVGSKQGVTDKTPVFSLVNTKTGEDRSHVVRDLTGDTLGAIMRGEVDAANSVLHIDSPNVHIAPARDFAEHHTVDHRAGEYVRGNVSTNVAEDYFSQLKRSIDGTHHAVSSEHLHRYVAEFDFRYNTRKMNNSLGCVWSWGLRAAGD